MTDNNKTTRTSVLVQVLTRSLIAIIIAVAGVYVLVNDIPVPVEMVRDGFLILMVFMGIDAIAKYQQTK